MGQLDGRCLCGKVTYHCDGEPMTTLLCHCTDCQRQTGTAFSIVVGVERDALHVEGTPSAPSPRSARTLVRPYTGSSARHAAPRS